MSKDKYNFTLSDPEIQELDRRRGMVSRSTYIGYLIRHAVTPIEFRTMVNKWCDICGADECGNCVFNGRFKEFMDTMMVCGDKQ